MPGGFALPKFGDCDYERPGILCLKGGLATTYMSANKTHSGLETAAQFSPFFAVDMAVVGILFCSLSLWNRKTAVMGQKRVSSCRTPVLGAG